MNTARRFYFLKILLFRVMSAPENIHTEFHRMLGREAKESQLKQRGHVFWMYGLSGSGKSTLANALERKLAAEGFQTKILDGDNIRSGLNSDLGFSDEDREENIRRIAEVARLFLDSGTVVLTSFITPLRSLRADAAKIVGPDDLTPVYVKASFETCAARDVKGLYAKAAEGGVQHFTGKDSSFEEPLEDDVDWTVSTDQQNEADSIAELYDRILPMIRTNSIS